MHHSVLPNQGLVRGAMQTAFSSPVARWGLLPAGGLSVPCCKLEGLWG